MCHVQIFRNDSTNFTRTHCLAYLVQNFPSYSRSITLPALGRMQRGDFTAAWAEDIWTNPLVQALVSLKFHFENLSEITNANLATELSDILALPAT